MTHTRGAAETKRGSRPKKSGQGFTLIELIITTVIMAIIMIIVALMIIEYFKASEQASSLCFSAQLAKREAAIIDALDFSDPTLVNGYTSLISNYAGSRFDLRRTIAPGTRTPYGSIYLRPIKIELYPNGSSVATTMYNMYAMDVKTGAGSGGGALDQEIASLRVTVQSNGKKKNSLALDFQNVRTNGNITITALKMSCSAPMTVTSITMNGDIRWTGSVTVTNSPMTTFTLDNYYYIHSNSTYSGTKGGAIAFNNMPNTTYAAVVQFICSDGSGSTNTWTF